MIVIDSSVVIAAFASWHELHERARSIVKSGPGVVAHTLLETYSVLTRLPGPHRVAPVAIATYLRHQFPHLPLVLDPGQHRALVGYLSREGITGGAVYDALIAYTVAEYDAHLVSLDARAVTTYERCGARFELVRA